MTGPLQITQVNKNFGGLQALDTLSFEVPENKIVGLIGPNGCGKTTTFNVTTGVLQADEGSIQVYGTEVTGMEPHEVNKLGLSRTFQHTRLWRDITVIENLLLPPKNQIGVSVRKSLFARRDIRRQEDELIEQAYETLEFLEITHMAHNYASELSGGQSKLVDLGRVLMSDPKFLLLDEPVAGVAGPLAEKIFKKIQELKSRGMSILMIEHNMDFILHPDVDFVFAMANGRIIASGSPKEIKRDSSVAEAYLGG